VKLGAACRILGIGSAKLDFGAAQLAGPAFSISPGAESWSHKAASYTMCGRFDADLGEYVRQEPSILKTVLQFRDIQAGVALRKEILSYLNASEGGEVAVAINGGLRKTIPTDILDKAKDQFVSLLVPSSASKQARPAIWNDARYSDEKALSLWKKRSHSIFTEKCKIMKIDPYGPCPCNSGEKMKFCCGQEFRF